MTNFLLNFRCCGGSIISAKRGHCFFIKKDSETFIYQEFIFKIGGVTLHYHQKAWGGQK